MNYAAVLNKLLGITKDPAAYKRLLFLVAVAAVLLLVGLWIWSKHRSYQPPTVQQRGDGNVGVGINNGQINSRTDKR